MLMLEQIPLAVGRSFLALDDVEPPRVAVEAGEDTAPDGAGNAAKLWTHRR